MKCFDTIRKWVGDGKELTHKVLSDNQLLILKINEVVGHSIAIAVSMNQVYSNGYVKIVHVCSFTNELSLP